MILALAVNPVQRYRNQYQIDSGRYWPMGTATHGFQIQLRQNGPKKPYRGAIPTLASNANSLDFRGKNEFSGAQNPLINTRFNTTNRIRAYRRNPGLNRSHHSNSLSFKLLEAL